MDARQLGAIGAAAVAAVIAIVAVVQLTGDDGDPPTTTSSSSTSSTSTTSTVTTEPPVPADLAARFFTELAARTPNAAARAQALTSPGSSARDYIDHQIAALAIVPAQDVGRVETVRDSNAPGAPDDVVAWRVCDEVAGGARCRTFTDLRVGGDGLLESFSIDGASIDGRLLVDGASTAHEQLVFGLTSAYRTLPDDTLVLVVDMSNDGDDDMLVNAFAAVYRDPSGTEHEATAVVGPDEVASGSSAQLLLLFESGAIGGELLLPGSTADFATTFEVALFVAEP